MVISYYDENGGSLEPLPNPIRIQTLEYDDQRRPVSRRMVLVKTGAIIERQMWYYNDDGSREEFLQYNDENGDLISKTTQKWDKNNQEILYTYYDSNGNNESVETTYYPNGNKKTEERSTPDSEDILWMKTEYYSNGNMSREEYRRFRETVWTTYWENGNPKELVNKHQAGDESHIKWNEEGKITYSKTVICDNPISTEEWYDDQGLKLKQINKDNISGETIIWEYDKNEQEISQTYYDSDGDKLVEKVYNEDRSFSVTEYDGKGNVISKTDYDANGQPVA